MYRLKLCNSWQFYKQLNEFSKITQNPRCSPWISLMHGLRPSLAALKTLLTVPITIVCLRSTLAAFLSGGRHPRHIFKLGQIVLLKRKIKKKVWKSIVIGQNYASKIFTIALGVINFISKIFNVVGAHAGFMMGVSPKSVCG